MTTISKSLCWAGALLLLAAGNALGLVADQTAQVLFIVLPIAAVTALRGDNRCRIGGRAA